MGLQQIIRVPTRDNYLLDLVLTDMNLEWEVGPKVADHAYIVVSMQARARKTVTVKRIV